MKPRNYFILGDAAVDVGHTDKKLDHLFTEDRKKYNFAVLIDPCLPDKRAWQAGMV